MNASICKSIVIVYNAQTKKYEVKSTPVIQANGELVPVVSLKEIYKHGAGTPKHKDILKPLRVKLGRVDKSRLKPEQMLMALRRHIVPSLYHVLIFTKATRNSLMTLERNNRFFVEMVSLTKGHPTQRFMWKSNVGAQGSPYLVLMLSYT